MSCALFAKMDPKKKKTLKKYWKNGKKYWKSQRILSVRKSGNPASVKHLIENNTTHNKQIFTVRNSPDTPSPPGDPPLEPGQTPPPPRHRPTFREVTSNLIHTDLLVIVKCS